MDIGTHFNDGKLPEMSHNKQHITVSSCKAAVWDVKQSYTLLLSEGRKLLNTPPTHKRAEISVPVNGLIAV